MAGQDIEPGFRHSARTRSGEGIEVTVAFEDTGAGTSSFSLAKAAGHTPIRTASWTKPSRWVC